MRSRSRTAAAVLTTHNDELDFVSNCMTIGGVAASLAAEQLHCGHASIEWVVRGWSFCYQ